MPAPKNESYYSRIGDYASLRVTRLAAMSVYTKVEPDQLENFLKRYDLGPASALEPIAGGITNTNYYLGTERGSFVLTLYEHHSDDELEFMLGLQQHLAGRGVACPAPLNDRRGGFFSMLNQRPAAIIHRLPGRVETRPAARHCALVGAELAAFHLQGIDFGGRRPNPRGLDWLLVVSDMLDAELGAGEREMLEKTLTDIRGADTSALPAGAIHADLFHDNALFVDGELGGIFDFDYACNDSFVFDIAVTLNDWCIDARGELDEALVDALLGAYRQQRRLERRELEILPLMLRFSALRFWISRLQDRIFPMSGELTFSKDPNEFLNLLELRTRSQHELTDLFLPHDVG